MVPYGMVRRALLVGPLVHRYADGTDAGVIPTAMPRDGEQAALIGAVMTNSLLKGASIWALPEAAAPLIAPARAAAA